MSEFNRKPGTENIFEGTSDEAIEVTLRLSDDFDKHFERNQDNTLKFEQVLRKIYGKDLFCYFQKQKEFERVDKLTGKTHKQSTQRVIIPLEDEKAIEGTLSLFNDEYSYRVVKLKQINFFSPPSKNTVGRNCKITFRQFNDYKGFVASEKFKELYSQIEQLQIPILDINKEKDKQIWHNYVVALKKLVKQKEQVWKIQKISQPYSEKREGDTERANYIDIFINERDLIDQLVGDIEDMFTQNELEDYGVSEDKAFIEFKSYRELNFEELSQLKELGEELFYELSSNSPTHYIAGEILFKYSENSSKEEIFSEIKAKLNSDYHLETDIEKDGTTDLDENDIPHLQKIIDDNYSNLLTVYRNNVVQLKVDFINGQELIRLKQEIKAKLDEAGLKTATTIISYDDKNLIIEVNAFVYQDKGTIWLIQGGGKPTIELSNELQLIKSVSRFSPNQQIKLEAIGGLEIVGNTYQIENATKKQVDDSLTLLKQSYPKTFFRRLQTLYFFNAKDKVNLETLRNFKTKTDWQGKSEFAFANSILKITAENKTDYETQLNRVKDSYPTAILETKPFNPTYQIQFRTDIESKRQSFINEIENEIRKAVAGKVEFDVSKNSTRVLFSYPFKSADERERLKQAVTTVCLAHQDILIFSFENDLGRSTYEFFKNETLELEKEKEVAGNVRQATFIYLTPEQREQLNKEIELKGDEAYFKEGIQIGKLIKKDRDRLKFRITDEFDERINAKEEDRIDLNEIRKGYIKPIFPGELTNIGRMIRAMKKVTEPGGRIGYPVNKNLSNFLFDPNEAKQSSADLEEEKQKVIADLNEPLLKQQQKQLEAVAKTLIAKDLALIQGPPGTGKTTVIAEIIWQTLLRDPQAKILITSQTNLAVDNALERIKGKKLVRPLRIGNTDKFEDEGKVYSNERIKEWIEAKVDSREEKINSDNAICKWIENVKEKSSEEEKYSKAIAKWKNGLNQKELLTKNVFSNAYYKYVNVFAATCSECGSPRFSEAYQNTFKKNSDSKSEPEFDIVIMDEASKATPPELILPLTLGKKVVIIGDHKQLPPMMDEREFGEALEAVGAKNLIEHWTKDDYKVSQFEKLFMNAPKNFVASLDTQFRMHEQIMNCISQFYTDQEELEHGLICGIKGEMDIPDFNVKASRWHGLKSEPFIDTKHHAVWVNVETPESKVGTSYENEGEIKAIQTVLGALTKAEGYQEYFNHFKKDEDKEIGIITYYMPQMQRIRNAMYPDFSKAEWKNFEQHKFENEFQLPFRINTVDRFQGMERNIIIISTVRSDKQFKDEKGRRISIDNNKYPFALGFARELQRINVGFSRAKRLLIVVGNEKHFSHKPEYAEAIQKMHRVDLMQIQNLISK